MCFQSALYLTITTLITMPYDYPQPEVSQQNVNLIFELALACAHLPVTTTHFSRPWLSELLAQWPSLSSLNVNRLLFTTGPKFLLPACSSPFSA